MDSTSEAREYLKGKAVLVTGVCGTVGKQLAEQLLIQYDVGKLVGLDHNESELVFLSERFGRDAPSEFILADVRDCEALIRETRGIDVIFHAAAYKHVHMCERSPLEAIHTNIIGVQNVIQAALRNNVKRLVFTSTDKAVNSTNVMGTSKLMGERLITAAACDIHMDGPVFLSTRFGNVLGSRGSVIPIFREQIRNGGPITLTDPAMTRFIMSLDEAVRLVIESVVLGNPGDVLITKMPSIRIGDLAQVMIRECSKLFSLREKDIDINVVGHKPGEKLYEELMNQEEIRRSVELGRFFVIRPPSKAKEKATYANVITDRVEQAYHSGNVPTLTQQEIAEFLHRYRLLEDV